MNRWVRAYTFVAVQLLNTLLLFLALNVGLAVVYRVRAWARPAPVPVPVVPAVFDLDAYSTISREQAVEYIQEELRMQGVGFQYEPWLLFRNPEHRGRLLNTDAHGFRRTRSPERRCVEPVRIFVFGGSTTFGYGVPDEQTIPSYLQAHLERRHPARCFQISNYGQGFFYSSQEMLLFIGLLKDGQVPDWAIFVDGANDTYQLSARRDVPYFSHVVQSLWDARRLGPACPSFDWSWLPAARLTSAIQKRIWGPPPAPGNDDPPPVPDADRSGTYAADRYKTNARMIRALCAEYGVQCRFVWQPTRFNYDDRARRSGEVPKFWTEAYEAIRQWRADDLLFLGDLFVGVREKVFVDDVHYNEAWNARIAGHIADLVDAGARRDRRSAR